MGNIKDDDKELVMIFYHDLDGFKSCTFLKIKITDDKNIRKKLEKWCKDNHHILDSYKI